MKRSVLKGLGLFQKKLKRRVKHGGNPKMLYVNVKMKGKTFASRKV